MRREQPGKLGDTEDLIGVDYKGDQELAGGGFRIVGGRASCVCGLRVTTAAPGSVGSVECVEAVSTPVRTESCFPNSLVTPLNDASSGSGRNSIRPVPQVHYFRFSSEVLE